MKVILIIVTIVTGRPAAQFAEYPMASWNHCLNAVKTAQIDVSHGAENGAGIAMVCTVTNKEKAHD